MKTYIQFFQQNAILKNNLIEATGDRAIIKLDGRCKVDNEWITLECQRRGYLGWQLIKGESLARAIPYTNIQRCDKATINRVRPIMVPQQY